MNRTSHMKVGAGSFATVYRARDTELGREVAVKQIHEQFNITMVYVTHDQLEASTFADKIAVMYGGQIVEHAPVRELFANPQHPYTQMLLAAEPKGEAEPVADNLTAEGKQQNRRVEMSLKK